MRVLDNGWAVSWGTATYGQLGHGGTFSVFSPKRISGMASPVKQCSSGYSYTMCVYDDGTVAAFGACGYGQTGLGRQTCPPGAN